MTGHQRRRVAAIHAALDCRLLGGDRLAHQVLTEMTRSGELTAETVAALSDPARSSSQQVMGGLLLALCDHPAPAARIDWLLRHADDDTAAAFVSALSVLVGVTAPPADTTPSAPGKP